MDWGPTRRAFLGGCLASAIGRREMFGAGSLSKGAGLRIQGSWIEFQHHNAAEGIYWNPACAGFTAQQWEAKVREMADLGFEYLVLLAVALDSRAYFDTAIFPQAELKCPDPVGTLLTAAARCGVKVFVSNGFFGDWRSGEILIDREARRLRLQAMAELAERYSAYPGFFGWYFPNEAEINPLFSDAFMVYARECAAEAKRLTPGKKTLIAPYGTRQVRLDDGFVRQLESLQVDIVAYQDEVGVQKTRPEELPRIFERLRQLHDRLPEVALWADVEIFQFEGAVYRSALLPAPWPRVKAQLEAVSQWVDKILVYQYLGMMNRPGSEAMAGHPDSTRLYGDYRNWLE